MGDLPYVVALVEAHGAWPMTAWLLMLLGAACITAAVMVGPDFGDLPRLAASVALTIVGGVLVLTGADRG